MTSTPTRPARGLPQAIPPRYVNQRARALSERWRRVAVWADHVARGYANLRLAATDVNSLEAAIAAASDLQHHRIIKDPDPTGKPLLTTRQHEILTELAAGHTTPQIAKTLCLGAETVKTHLSRIYRVLGATNGPQAVCIAMRYGILK